MTRHRCLVTGGARSGKSAWAEGRLAGEPVRYLATGYPVGVDAEWDARVIRHRDRRPDAWITEESLDIAAALRRPDSRPLLVDCLTLWLTRVIDAADAWQGGPAQARLAIAPAIDALLAGLVNSDTECVLVTNEVGSGVIPTSESGRVFVDLLGELNAGVAAVCDEVVLMVAGIPVVAKGGPPPWRIA